MRGAGRAALDGAARAMLGGAYATGYVSFFLSPEAYYKFWDQAVVQETLRIVRIFSPSITRPLHECADERERSRADYQQHI
ncbi:MAG: hypothetical protein ACOX4F_03345 [Atopobiaceae bacterium]